MLCQTLFLLLGGLLLAARTSGAAGACTAEAAEYRGWQTLRLANGLVTLDIAPDIGGRVIQFKLGEHPYLFVNAELAGKLFPPEQNGGDQSGWKNYGGSKLWPAPQGWQRDDQWPGPPDPVLDGGRYQGEITQRDPDRVAVTVTSPPDPRTGLQLGRTIRLEAGSTQVRHECVMKNISRRRVRWSIWEVVQHDTSDAQQPRRWNPDFWAYCPLHPQSAHPRGFSPMFGQVTHPSYRPEAHPGLLAIHYEYRVGKVGLDSPAGWLAVVNGQSEHGFIGRFPYFPSASYPDHATVEFWLNGAGEFILNGLALTNAPDPVATPYLMESEILGPLVDLDPGEEYRFRIDWLATRCPKPVVDVTAAAAISRPLAVSLDGSRVRLEGVFGVFSPGQAEAVFKAADGRVVGRETLGPVHPHQVFRLSRQLLVPPQTFRMVVQALDGDGEVRGILGEAQLL